MKILALVLMIAILAVPVSAQIGENIELTLMNQNPDPVEPGDSVELRFRVDNEGAESLEAIQVELLESYPFSINGPAVKNLGSIDSKTSGTNAFTVKYDVLVDRTADEASSDIYIRYRVGNGAWVRMGPFSVEIGSAHAILGVLSVDSMQDSGAGSVSDFDVVLHNYGKSLVRDVSVKMELGSVPFSPVGTSNIQVIESIPSGESKTASFRLIADSDAQSGYYKTNLFMDYIDDSGNSHSRNATISLLLYDEPKYSISVKKTSVYTPDSNGDVTLSISNIGPSQIRFLTVSLEDGQGYRVVSAERELYLGNLDSDDFETAEFKIRTGNANSPVSLNALLSYSDSFNRQIVKEEVIALPVYSRSDASRFGLLPDQQSFAVAFFGIAVQVLVAMFIIAMLIDCWKNNIPKYRKVLWTIVILTVIGSVIYYLIARRKK